MESGEITSPLYNRFNYERLNCMYRIKVPRGRRVTAEVIKGTSILTTCDSLKLQTNLLKEKLTVSFPF